MIELLKILHIFAVAAGVGGGLANVIVIRAAAASEPDAANVLRALAPRIGAMTFHALILLWITGPLLLWMVYESPADLGFLFHLKMLGVVLLTLIAGAVRITVLKIRAGKPAPLAPKMPTLVPLAALFSVATLVLGVLTFS
jgi:uncharacterized membrane protein